MKANEKIEELRERFQRILGQHPGVTITSLSVKAAGLSALLAEYDRQRQALGNLLAIIHRDGGHHQAKVGDEQAVKDAHQVWADLISMRDAALQWLRDPATYRREINIALKRCGACRNFTLAYHDMAIGRCSKIAGRRGAKLMADECEIGEFTQRELMEGRDG